ncbi:MAG: [protein-PII] uridylyltransferase, partial [Candidatus Binataceae bacterium]
MNDAGAAILADGATARGAARDEATLAADLGQTGSAGAVAREFLEQVRAELFARHRDGAGGLEIVRELTAATDRLIRALFLHADAAHTRRRFSRLNQRLTVIARGGYGRGELNPRSDLDLIFLHDYKRGPYAEIVTEGILYALFDVGLEIGYAVRSIGECVSMAAGNLWEKTALLDARFLAGDDKLYAQFEKKLVSDVLNRDQANFFKAKLEETRERHSRYGDSVYLLEPNLKEGDGGLRDLHTALWLAKVKYKVRTFPELMQKAVINERELAEITAAQDFLYRVRNSIHFLERRHVDQITFELQEQIAPILDFRDREGNPASAQLMRAYYQQASVIRQFSEHWLARVREEIAPQRFLWRRQSRVIRPGVVIQQESLGLTDADFFRRAPLNLVSLFADCQAHGVELSGSAFQAVRDNLGLAGAELRNNPQTGDALFGILRGPARVAETLEAMHRAGVLGAIIPEFGNLEARVLHDLYHIYTVDRHSLAAIGYLERLRAGEFKDDNALLTQVARACDNLPLIYLALLLHDIGKGYGHDHHERGAVLTEQVCARLGLDSEQTDLVVFLVRHHLWMSQVAQKGDVNDARTVDDFARLTGSIDRLKALYLMTFADMRAVAPKVYNMWRDMLLSELYIRALKPLEQGNKEAVDPARRLALVKRDVREMLEGGSASPVVVAKFLELMPDRYFLTAPEGDIRMHFEMMRALDEGEPLVCRNRAFAQLEFTEFTVVTRDQPGLFAKIAGVLSANNLDILAGQITTRADRVALDVFRVALGPGELALEEERWDRVNRTLERVLAGELEVGELVAAALRRPLSVRKPPRRTETEVIIDNRSSDDMTVVDVFTFDRAGLLFAITYTIFELGYVIHLARISTNADQAFDVFYISDSDGNKIEDLERMRALKLA